MWPFTKRDRRHDNAGHQFTEEERDRSQISQLENSIRKQRIKFLREKLERLKQAQEVEQLEEQVAETEAELNGDDDDEEPEGINADAMFMQLIAGIFGGRQAIAQNAPPTNNPVAKKTLNDDELRTFRDKVPPAYLKKAKKMSDDELIDFVSAHRPEFLIEYDDDTIKRALKILKE